MDRPTPMCWMHGMSWWAASTTARWATTSRDRTRASSADGPHSKYQRTIADYKAFSRKEFERDSKRFLDMLAMQDQLLGTRSEFRLGTRLSQARACGNTDEERNLYEWNARVQITTWGNRYCADTGGLHDYAHKEWQGLLADFYAVRWKTYFDALSQQMRQMTLPNPEMLGTGTNSNKTADELFQMALPQEVTIDYYAIEEPWTLQHNAYGAEPVGSPVEMARKAMSLIQ